MISCDVSNNMDIKQDSYKNIDFVNKFRKINMKNMRISMRGRQ